MIHVMPLEMLTLAAAEQTHGIFHQNGIGGGLSVKPLLQHRSGSWGGEICFPYSVQSLEILSQPSVYLALVHTQIWEHMLVFVVDIDTYGVSQTFKQLCASVNLQRFWDGF